jgi:hypothetical protein
MRPALLALLVVMNACAGRHQRVQRAPQASGAWRELATTHFVVASDLPSGQGEHVTRELEEYLAALAVATFGGVDTRMAPIPVIAFATRAELADYVQTHYQGFYLSRLFGRPMIVAGGGEGGFHDGLARHELAHHVMRLAFRRDLPRWLDEGGASFLETVAYDRDGHVLLLGRASWSRVNTVKTQGLVPVADVLAGRFDEHDDKAIERFYATSWLLVHDLESTHHDALASYFALLRGGAPPAEAWERALPSGLRAGLDAELASYFARRGYEVSWRQSWTAPEVGITARDLLPNEILVTRALVHVAAGLIGDSSADRWRPSAAALVSEVLRAEPGNAQAQAIRRLLEQPPAPQERPH